MSLIILKTNIQDLKIGTTYLSWKCQRHHLIYCETKLITWYLVIPDTIFKFVQDSIKIHDYYPNSQFVNDVLGRYWDNENRLWHHVSKNNCQTGDTDHDCHKIKIEHGIIDKPVKPDNNLKKTLKNMTSSYN